MSCEMASEEENGWIAAAAAIDGGKGLPLEKFDPDDKEDMKDLYDALNVSNLGAKSRLRRFVRRLREPKATASQRKSGLVSYLFLVSWTLHALFVLQ